MTGARQCRINGLSVMRFQAQRPDPSSPAAVSEVEVGLTLSLTTAAPPLLAAKMVYKSVEWPPAVQTLLTELLEAIEQTIAEQSGLFAGTVIQRDPTILDVHVD